MNKRDEQLIVCVSARANLAAGRNLNAGLGVGLVLLGAIAHVVPYWGFILLAFASVVHLWILPSADRDIAEIIDDV